MHNSSLQIIEYLSQRRLDGHGDRWRAQLDAIGSQDVERALAMPAGVYDFHKLMALISPAAEDYLEPMARLSQQLTVQRFGKTMKLYIPLYLSNYCINRCAYCGFNTAHAFEKTRLTIAEALDEAAVLHEQGFADLLLVSGEDPQYITVDYLVELAGKLRKRFSSISVEIYAMDTGDYARLFEAGVEGVTLYQETYDRDVYAYYHRQGPKADYDYRLGAPDRFAQAGMRQCGLGVLLGLNDWRVETLALAEHGHYLMKKYWQSQISFSFPRLRPAYQSDQQYAHLVSDKNMVQMITALRLCFADAGLVLSTRESAAFRDHCIHLGITRISAGSRTNPGGYLGRDRAVRQFEIDDSRSAADVAGMIKQHGFDPVWKDWDRAFGQTASESKRQ